MTVSVSGAMGCDEQRWLHHRRPQAVMLVEMKPLCAVFVKSHICQCN